MIRVRVGVTLMSIILSLPVVFDPDCILDPRTRTSDVGPVFRLWSAETAIRQAPAVASELVEICMSGPVTSKLYLI